jgi:hypothetical protein
MNFASLGPQWLSVLLCSNLLLTILVNRLYSLLDALCLCGRV